MNKLNNNITIDGNGLRFNNDKTRYSEIPPAFIAELANHCCLGEVKYPNLDGQPNWSKGLSFQSLLDCIDRHISAFKAGDSMDEDFDTSHHLIAATWNLMVLHFMDTHYDNYIEFDDRMWKDLPISNTFDSEKINSKDYGTANLGGL